MGQYRSFDEDGGAPLLGYNWASRVSGLPVDHSGTAQGGAAGSITLSAAASVIANAYKDLWAAILTGTGTGQIRKGLTGYNGTSKLLPVTPVWTTPPDATSTYRLFLARRVGLQNVGPSTLASVIGRLAQNGLSPAIAYPLWAKDITALSCPFGVSATVSAAGAGGLWAATCVPYYRIVGVKGSGKTTGSIEVGGSIDVTTKALILNWTALPGSPDNILIHRTFVPGDYTSLSSFLVSLAGGVTTYTDLGNVALGGTGFPLVNSTGGFAVAPYGIPPASLLTTDISFGDLAPGQMVFYWEVPDVPTGEQTQSGSWLRQFTP